MVGDDEVCVDIYCRLMRVSAFGSFTVDGI